MWTRLKDLATRKPWLVDLVGFVVVVGVFGVFAALFGAVISMLGGQVPALLWSGLKGAAIAFAILSEPSKILTSDTPWPLIRRAALFSCAVGPLLVIAPAIATGAAPTALDWGLLFTLFIFTVPFVILLSRGAWRRLYRRIRSYL